MTLSSNLHQTFIKPSSKLISLVVLISFTFSSTKIFAQLYSSGISTITSTNVGIGTSTPTSRLQLLVNPSTPSGTPHLKLTQETLGGPPTFTVNTFDWSIFCVGEELKFSHSNSLGYPSTQLFGINKDYVKVSAPSFIVNSNFKVDLTGNVGIGTLSPDSKLHIPSGTFHINTGSIKVDYGTINLGPSAMYPGSIFQVENGDIRFINGRLIVGAVTTTPGGYSIYAKNGILTERVKVAISSTSDWSDFVFDKNYQLLPLPELKKYITINKHLPSLPSANDVVCDGIDLAKMDATLLLKIEELTLYTLDLYQNNEALKRQLELMQLQINNLKKTN
jgi:hypothetical protein